MKSFSYVTAKERYLDALENFEEKKNSLKKQNSEWLDFIGDIDSCSMAIIESYRIKKVTEIKVSDLGGLLQYSNNNF